MRSVGLRQELCPRPVAGMLEIELTTFRGKRLKRKYLFKSTLNLSSERVDLQRAVNSRGTE